MASFVADGNAVWAPNPEPERGASCSLDSHGSKLLYVSGYSVIIRDAGDPADVMVYTGHRKACTVARFSLDGRLVASGDSSGAIRVWTVDDKMETKKELQALGGAVFDIAWDDTGKRLAVCGDAKGTNARVFMWESGSPQGELAGSAKRVLSIAIRPESPSRLATGSEDTKVRIHSGPPYKFTGSFEGHSNFIQCLRYSPCGSMLAVASSDMSISILDAESGDLMHTLPTEHKGSVYSVAWSDDSTQLLSCSGDKSVKLWDAKKAKCVGTVVVGKAVADMQVGCAFAGGRPASISLSGDLNLLDMAKGSVASVLQAQTNVITSLARDWSADGAHVFAGTASGPVYAFAPDGTATRFEGAEPGCNDGLTVNQGKLFSVGHDDTLRCAAVGDGKFSFAGATASLASTPVGVSAGPADPGLAATATAGAVLLVRDGKQKDSKSVKGFEATCVAMADDATELVVGGTDKAAHVFSVAGDKLTDTSQALGGMQGVITAVRYSTTGKHIAVGDNVKEITLWDRATKECLIRAKWVFHTSVITSLAFSPNGQYLASGSNDTQVIVWNVDKKMAKTKIQAAHALGVTAVEWLDDETIVSAGGDRCVRKWKPTLPK